MMVKYTDSTLNTACPEVDGSKFLLSSLKNNTALFKGAESEDERYVELFCFFFLPNGLPWHHRPSSFGVC